MFYSSNYDKSTNYSKKSGILYFLEIAMLMRVHNILLYNFKAVFWPYFRILNYKSKTGSLAKIANALFCKTKMLLTKTKINYDSNISVNFVYLKKKAVRHKIRVSHTSLGKQNIFITFANKRLYAFIVKFNLSGKVWSSCCTILK